MNIALIVTIIIILGVLRLYFRYKGIKKLQNRAFKKAYGNTNFPEPSLKISSNYGYPTFNLHFQKERDYKYSEIHGLNKLYKEEIQKIHASEGEFNSEYAVFINYDK